MPATYQKLDKTYCSIGGKIMSKPGRRCKREQVLEALSGYLRQGMNYQEATKQVGVSRQSLHRWMSGDEGYAFKVRLAKEIGRREAWLEEH